MICFRFSIGFALPELDYFTSFLGTQVRHVDAIRIGWSGYPGLQTPGYGLVTLQRCRDAL